MAKVRHLPIRTSVTNAGMSVRLNTLPGFERLLRRKGQFTSQIGAVNELHRGWAGQVVTSVADELTRLVATTGRAQGARPGGRPKQDGIRRTLRGRMDRFYDLTPATMARSGFAVDFNRLDEYGPRDENGQPYWRNVLRPKGGGMAVEPGEVRAFFISSGGKLSVAQNARQGMDTRMPNFGGHAKMKPVLFRGFVGHDFIEPPVRETLTRIKSVAAREYLDNLNWPPEAMAAMRAAIGGQYMGRGVVRDPKTNRMTRDARIF